MKYIKLIGFRIDTNQYTSTVITDENDAIFIVNKVINIYGADILKYLFLTLDKRFSTYSKNDTSLHDFLNSK